MNKANETINFENLTEFSYNLLRSIGKKQCIIESDLNKAHKQLKAREKIKALRRIIRKSTKANKRAVADIESLCNE